MVTILPPHVVHDGRTASSARKRVVYLETSLLGEHLIGPAVDHPVIADRTRRQDLSGLHDALFCADDRVEAETRLKDVAERIRLALGEPPPAPPVTPAKQLADALRAFLDAHALETITIATAAEQLGAGPTHLARTFAQVFGIPPHAYVLGRRLDAAREKILRGQPLAEVAVEVGFVDQAHLTRRFKRFLGTTPGRFAAAARS